MKSQSVRADLLMLLAAAIWGFAFVAQREGMETMGPFLFNTARFFIGTVFLFPIVSVSYTHLTLPTTPYV